MTFIYDTTYIIQSMFIYIINIMNTDYIQLHRISYTKIHDLKTYYS